jgi:hypothetical protein
MNLQHARIRDLERGLQYLRGCLDLARERTTELRGDYAYVEKKIAAATEVLAAAGLLAPIHRAVMSSRVAAVAQHLEAADEAITQAEQLLRARLTQPAPRLDS